MKGSIDARQATVVRPDVECPSLSPDGSLVVFKKPLKQEVGWQLHVLDLATGAEHPLNQVRRSVDDQVDWFDDRHVVYHDSASEGTGMWMLLGRRRDAAAPAAAERVLALRSQR